MIQKRGIRLPRRSMRLKRQVDMEDLINLFGNDRFYDEEAQIPGRFSGYPETPAPEYRYPYVFQHRDLGILNPGNEMEDNTEALEGDNMEDVDNLMLMPPIPDMRKWKDMGMSRGDDEKEAIQSWLNRHTVPSVFRVSRRSAPYFYPIDYRYIPGYKKRSRLFSNGNRDLGRFSGDEEPERASSVSGATSCRFPRPTLLPRMWPGSTAWPASWPKRRSRRSEFAEQPKPFLPNDIPMLCSMRGGFFV
ncbi:uncharacterized protein CEXT_222241 [Caerostris extrusa]|uniref:Uncharacterized protein n=1 Tax=Caerostris extrusa TaxID=172846 RepID=A0AAV4WFP1_CAEEX|nr:uncharacterized protein CEXT_222241 [Caerostris extrusa]